MAESYERVRPTYRPELVEWLVDRLGIGPGKTVVDVGAGTGKLTRQLVPTGAHLVAVEPLAEMRAQFELAVPGVEVLAGTAEELPLQDAGADAIVVASAIHWFDIERALAEFHRVLRPGGRLGVIGQGRDLSDPLQAALQEIVGERLPDIVHFVSWREAVAEGDLFGAIETFETTNEQLLDAEGLADRVGTISHVARLSEGERADIHARVRALGEAQPESPFPFRYRTSASVCRRRNGDYPLGR